MTEKQLCGAPLPWNPAIVCVYKPGHDGPHQSKGAVWRWGTTGAVCSVAAKRQLSAGAA